MAKETTHPGNAAYKEAGVVVLNAEVLLGVAGGGMSNCRINYAVKDQTFTALLFIHHGVNSRITLNIIL